MTCAHVVDVALKKVAGVESVEVSLNKGLATVKLKPGNSVSVPQLWELIHKNGYTPKATAVSVRGDLSNANGRLELKVRGPRKHWHSLPIRRTPRPTASPQKSSARPLSFKA